MFKKDKLVLTHLLPMTIMYYICVLFIRDGNLPDVGQLIDQSVAIMLVTLALYFFRDLVPKGLKEFLVFWRRENRLESHRSFTNRYLNNSRLDSKKVEIFRKNGVKTPEEQNQIWYSMYQKLVDDGGVSSYSSLFLSWRETATLSLGLSLASFFISFDAEHWSFGKSLLLAAIFFGFYLLSVISARSASEELVLNVLAKTKVE